MAWKPAGAQLQNTKIAKTTPGEYQSSITRVRICFDTDACCAGFIRPGPHSDVERFLAETLLRVERGDHCLLFAAGSQPPISAKRLPGKHGLPVTQLPRANGRVRLAARLV